MTSVAKRSERGLELRAVYEIIEVGAKTGSFRVEAPKGKKGLVYDMGGGGSHT